MALVSTPKKDIWKIPISNCGKQQVDDIISLLFKQFSQLNDILS